MTEKEKMLKGELYLASDPQLAAEHLRTVRLCREYNETDAGDKEKLDRILRELTHVEGEKVTIEQPIRFDYGSNTYFGDNAYLNCGVTILDVCEVRIGKNVLIAPNVVISAATHPVDPAVRATGKELGKPIVIGDNVWLGAGVIVCPGVTIGENTTIGAGSVVVKDIPANCLAAGNPCKVIREL